ncbi:SdrD B-like domain-containing protein [Portibacter lacus]|uniref:SdrD B-like domain-containing protein n=1 Tax=Portibacter lacus TaxID=1099794 RepID=UPI001F4246E1|nr:SdrD B-like domain-containing protein [Portibacter lacus]
MKTPSKILICSLFLCYLCSCETEQSTCANDNSYEEFIEWSFTDETFELDFDHVDVYYADDRFLNIYPITPIPQDGPYNDFWIKYDVVEESAHYRAGSFTADNTFIFTYGSDLEMTVSSFFSTGDLICIQFDDGEFSGEVRVVLDKIVKSGKVEGKVWLDENENGINEPNESPLANVDLYLRTDSANLVEGIHDVYPIYYPTSRIKTDDNGHFTFNGVFVNYPIQVGYSTKEESNVTTANAGNDDTIDSDFHFTRETTYRKWYTSDPFIIEEGGIKKDIGLGIIER